SQHSFHTAASSTARYSLSLHDALPISAAPPAPGPTNHPASKPGAASRAGAASRWQSASRHDQETHTVSWISPLHSSVGAASRRPDRKSTRLNSSHVKNSYAVFCLKKKK